MKLHAKTVEAKNIIIATGSKPSSLPFIKIDKERIITSTEALKLKEVPKPDDAADAIAIAICGANNSKY